MSRANILLIEINEFLAISEVQNFKICRAFAPPIPNMFRGSCFSLNVLNPPGGWGGGGGGRGGHVPPNIFRIIKS